MKKFKFFGIMGFLILLVISLGLTSTLILFEEIKEEKEEEVIPPVKETKIKINAVGDCTIGYDDNFGYNNSFNYYYDKYGEDYFFGGVKHLFLDDDITIANLETTFTDATEKVKKKFNFKAPKDYVNIVKNSGIEVVNIANNHTYDYGKKGYDDTIEVLQNANVNFVGYDYLYVYNKEDIKIGFAGIYCIEDKSCTTKIDKAISELNKLEVDNIVLSFHWGLEYHYEQSSIQTYLAHYAIDNGADLILGHHPHILQGIELYNNKYIVYSLGNFSFGGNKNPKDKDTMIFNIEFDYIDKKLTDTKIKIYPTKLSSVKNLNDYRPTLAIGEEKEEILNKLQTYSKNVNLKDLNV